jgi:co-chaperonin GroES (HSP10)
MKFGVRDGHESLYAIPANKTIRPLRDQIVIEPLPAKPSKIIELVENHVKPLRGKVLAVGPGCYPWLYQEHQGGPWSQSVPKGKRIAQKQSTAFRPCDVKPGDTVELGGLEIGGYLHPRVRWGDKEVVVCREEDVAVVVE